MTLIELLDLAKDAKITFADCLAFIEKNYLYTPGAFKNGKLLNLPSENQGSAKVLYFAKLNKLSKEDTLLLFAEHFQNVLSYPQDKNHQNIRQFIENGWDGVDFDSEVLHLL